MLVVKLFLYTKFLTVQVHCTFFSSHSRSHIISGVFLQSENLPSFALMFTRTLFGTNSYSEIPPPPFLIMGRFLRKTVNCLPNCFIIYKRNAVCYISHFSLLIKLWFVLAKTKIKISRSKTRGGTSGF